MSSFAGLQAEYRADWSHLRDAELELRTNLANWSPAFYGSMDYMLGYAATGQELRFFAVKRGGLAMKPVSMEFDITRPLHRVQVWRIQRCKQWSSVLRNGP